MRIAFPLILLTVLLPTRVAAEDDSLYMARLVARGFFQALQDREAAAMLPLCAEGVSFDGELVKGRAKVRARLERVVARARQRNLRLKKVLLLRYQEALEVLGPPPERLKQVLGKGQMVALAAFQRGGAIAVLERRGAFWRVVALTD